MSLAHTTISYACIKEQLPTENKAKESGESEQNCKTVSQNKELKDAKRVTAVLVIILCGFVLLTSAPLI